MPSIFGARQPRFRQSLVGDANDGVAQALGKPGRLSCNRPRAWVFCFVAFAAFSGYVDPVSLSMIEAVSEAAGL